MNNRRIIITAVFLIIAVGNYFSIANNNVRAIEFVSIFVIGVFFGVLLVQISKIFANRNKPA